MGKAFLAKSNGGGGGGLAFRVLGGTSAPSNPKPNDIWVNTNKEITSYIFSATEPEGYAEGMVWISTGTSSTVEFNALKKNGIQIYPIAAKQYTSGAWKDVTAKSYQNGAWVDWWDGYLYDYGDKNESITGGWVGTSNAKITFNSTNMSLTSSGNSKVYTKNKIDLTSVKYLLFEGTLMGDSVPQYRSLCVFADTPSSNDYSNLVAYYTTTIYDSTCQLDVSSLSGSYPVGFAVRDDTHIVKSLKVVK